MIEGYDAYDEHFFKSSYTFFYYHLTHVYSPSKCRYNIVKCLFKFKPITLNSEFKIYSTPRKMFC